MSINDAGIAQKLIEVEEYIGQLERERDEARAELSCEYQRAEEAQERAGQFKAEVERLRAAQRSDEDIIATLTVDCARLRAQQLPDVGPVTRDGDKLWVNGCVYWDRFTAETWRKDGAERLALAAFLDAEAVDHTHDDEVEEEAGDPGVTYEEQEYEVVVSDFLEEAFDGVPDVQELDPSVLATGIVREVVKRRAQIRAHETKVRADQRDRDNQDGLIEMFNAITAAFDPEGTDEFRGDTVDAVLNAIHRAGYEVRARNGQEAGQ